MKLELKKDHKSGNLVVIVAGAERGVVIPLSATLSDQVMQLAREEGIDGVDRLIMPKGWKQ